MVVVQEEKSVEDGQEGVLVEVDQKRLLVAVDQEGVLVQSMCGNVGVDRSRGGVGTRGVLVLVLADEIDLRKSARDAAMAEEAAASAAEAEVLPK